MGIALETRPVKTGGKAGTIEEYNSALRFFPGLTDHSFAADPTLYSVRILNFHDAAVHFSV